MASLVLLVVVVLLLVGLRTMMLLLSDRQLNQEKACMRRWWVCRAQGHGGAVYLHACSRQNCPQDYFLPIVAQGAAAYTLSANLSLTDCCAACAATFQH
jgi:hypothetical protein